MDVVHGIYTGYGDKVNQGKLAPTVQGAAEYLASLDKLDVIKKCVLDDGSGAADLLSAASASNPAWRRTVCVPQRSLDAGARTAPLLPSTLGLPPWRSPEDDNDEPGDTHNDEPPPAAEAAVEGEDKEEAADLVEGEPKEGEEKGGEEEKGEEEEQEEEEPEVVEAQQGTEQGLQEGEEVEEGETRESKAKGGCKD